MITVFCFVETLHKMFDCDKLEVVKRANTLSSLCCSWLCLLCWFAHWYCHHEWALLDCQFYWTCSKYKVYFLVNFTDSICTVDLLDIFIMRHLCDESWAEHGIFVSSYHYWFLLPPTMSNLFFLLCAAKEQILQSIRIY